MAEGGEGAANHLVHESMGRVELRDPRRHPPQEPEVSSLPAHLLSLADQARRDAGDRALLRRDHRFQMQVDAPGKVEAHLSRGCDVGHDPENRHACLEISDTATMVSASRGNRGPLIQGHEQTAVAPASQPQPASTASVLERGTLGDGASRFGGERALSLLVQILGGVPRGRRRSYPIRTLPSSSGAPSVPRRGEQAGLVLLRHDEAAQVVREPVRDAGPPGARPRPRRRRGGGAALRPALPGRRRPRLAHARRLRPPP